LRLPLGTRDGVRVLIRRETPEDIAAIRSVTAQAFEGLPHSLPPLEADGVPGEATLVGRLRAGPGWIASLSLVAEDEAGRVVGHAVSSRGDVDGVPALGLGPVSVAPYAQRTGVGSALVHASLAAADALGEPLVALLGDPAYYSRFGFRPAASLGIAAPDPGWGEFFQVRTLAAYDAALTGTFRYAAAFETIG
jgi:putative acetyltransferase